ncbi:unnamed protein product, partial [Discosporangium mesarthrocarpum]
MKGRKHEVSSVSHSSLFFQGVLFFVVQGHGPGEEKLRMKDLISRHGGRCLDGSDTASPSDLRNTLSAHAAHVSPGAGNPLPHGSRHLAPPLPQGQCLVVANHGKSPWHHNWHNTSQPRAAREESARDRRGGNLEDHGKGKGVGVEGTGPGPGAGGQQWLWDLLREEAGAELVTDLWVETCHRVGEYLPPGSCSQVFRPLPWPIARPSPLAKGSGEEGGWSGLSWVGDGAEAGEGGWRDFRVTVAGFPR